MRVRLDQRIGEGEEPGRGRDQSRKVESLLTRGVPRLVDEETCRERAEHADRHVDEEDPAPAGLLGEETPDEWADRKRERGHAGPDPDGRAALARREGGGDDRERRRV